MEGILASHGIAVKEKLCETEKTVVYRGTSAKEHAPVMIKILKEKYPSLHSTSSFRNDYETLKSLRGVPGIISPIDFINEKNKYLILLENFNGKPLSAISKKLTDRILHDGDWDCFLEIVIRLANTLGNIHHINIIHKDINPHNIFLNPNTYDLRFMDFGISTRLPYEKELPTKPTFLEGTPFYISPEQTGRMNRSVDYRTDMYSLGTVLYEMVLGYPPFQSDNPLEVIHHHIAGMPEAPHRIDARIPRVISDIIMKLLSKNAEDRYRSAFGLMADVQECLEQLRTAGRISDDFIIAGKDVSEKLYIPQKLYGREEQIRRMMEVFFQVREGCKKLTLVTGAPGIGKSSLVGEMVKQVIDAGGFFIRGKYNEQKINLPYLGFIQAFQGLIKQILADQDDVIQCWKDRILDSLGINGQVIIELIPELEYLIGKQPPVMELPPIETINRFNIVFLSLVSIFSQKEHPLVIFLDDLQWVDPASLELIKSIMLTSLNLKHLYLIGAFRDTEVPPNHPLSLALDEIKEKMTDIERIALEPLSESNINKLVGETFECRPDKAKSLSQLLQIKTIGNPFFLKEFLTSLYAEGLLSFNINTRQWEWDVPHIQSEKISDNVTVLMIDKFQKLLPQTQDALKLASCLGSRFNLQALSFVDGKSIKENANDLWEAFEENLLVGPTSVIRRIRYADERVLLAGTMSDIVEKIELVFAHDRVFEAVHSLVPENEKIRLHLAIGRELVKRYSEEDLEENLFAVVNQLNAGSGLIREAAERLELTHLNLRAGLKARYSAAYKMAVEYLATALSLLPENSWESHYGITLSIHEALIEAEFLHGNFDRLESLFTIILKNAHDVLDSIKTYETMILYYNSQSMYQTSLNTAVHVAGLLGVKIPRKSSIFNIVKVLLKTMLTLRGKSIHELEAIGNITDAKINAVLKILRIATPPAYLGEVLFLPILTCTQVLLSLKYGYNTTSYFAWIMYGSILAGMGNIKKAHEYAKLGLRLIERNHAADVIDYSVFPYSVFVSHWVEHINVTVSMMKECRPRCLSVGNFEFEGYFLLSEYNLRLWKGDYLQVLDREYADYFNSTSKYKLGQSLTCLQVNGQMAANLMGKSDDVLRMKGERFDEDVMIDQMIGAHFFYALLRYNLCKMVLALLFKDHNMAFKYMRYTEKIMNEAPASFDYSKSFFYFALILLTACRNAGGMARRRYLRKAGKYLKAIVKWAQFAPENFEHEAILIEAEKARVLGQSLKAMDLYDIAVQKARDNGFIHDMALANELAAEFYMDIKKEKIARIYLNQAKDLYAQWGAAAKVEQLLQSYPLLLKEPLDPTQNGARSAAALSSDTMDITSITKFSQAISSEIVLDTLIGKLMKIVVENAGATNGALLIERDGTFVIAAQSILEKDVVTTLTHEPFAASRQTPQSVINYVLRTREAVVLSDAAFEGNFMADPYIAARASRSILCLPILEQARPIGVIYLENTKVKGAFTPERIATLQLLASQAAISLKNALTFDELTQTRQILKESEENYRNLFENMQDAFIRCDLNGKIVLLSPSAEKITGYTIPERLGKDITELLCAPPSNREAFIKEFLTQEYGENFETQIKHKDGHMLWVSINYHQYRDRRGNLLGIEGIVRNITERKLAEEEKKILERQLIQSQKMESIGTLAGGIAHDFNNILASVIGFADLAKSKLQRGMNIEKELEGVFVAGLRARDLVKQILTFSRKTNIQHIPLNLLPLIKESVKFIRASLPATIEIRQDLHVSNDIVLGDPTQIHQVFMNLCANAAYAMKEGGALGISLKELEMTGKTFPEGNAYLKAIPPGRYLQLSITDTGCGMPQEMLDKIFNPFFTTKPHGEGTGLGLSVVHGIIQNMGGHITVYSESGRGTTFHIFMPALTEDTMDAGRKTQGVDPPKGQGTILFVDDEPGIIESGQGILEALGYQVISFTDPVRALSTFKQTPRIYDAVLTDMTMPGLTGLELSKCVTELRPDLPVLLYSGLGAGVTEEALKQAGIKKMIMKPMIAKELAETLFQLLN